MELIVRSSSLHRDSIISILISGIFARKVIPKKEMYGAFDSTFYRRRCNL